MQFSYLIYGNNEKNRLTTLIDLLSSMLKKNVDLEWLRGQADIKIIEIPEDKKSIGIAQAKEGIRFLNEKPFSLKKKFLIIPKAQYLTKDAQNSLLKTLEEPPEYAAVFLITPAEEDLLGTVVSRCKKIEAKKTEKDKNIRTSNKDSEKEIVESEKEENNNSIAKLLDMSLGQRLDWAGEYAKKEKEDILNLFDNWIQDERVLLLKNSQDPIVAENINKIINVKKDLAETNINTRLALEFLVLNLQ